MAVRINPCYRCPIRSGCERRRELARKVSGLGLRSAAFVCDRLKAEVRPGRRVIIKQPILAANPNSWEPEVYVTKREVAATITSTSGYYRFACTVDKMEAGNVEFLDDDANRKRFRKTQAHYRIVRFLDEPDGKICPLGNVVNNGLCDCRDGNCECEEAA